VTNRTPSQSIDATPGLPHSLKKHATMKEHELLLAQPRKISFLLEKFSKSLDLAVKKQNAPWNSLRSPRRVLFFHSQISTFLAFFS